MTVSIEMSDLVDLSKYFDRFSDASAQAMSLAMNTVIQRGGMKLVQERMYDEVAFPKGYLGGDRLYVNQFAKPNNLQVSIVGRKRATSLARFASGQPIGSKGKLGVRVQVQKGTQRHMKNAWLVRLKKGTSLTEDNYNVGLAVRLGPGESVVNNKRTMHKSWLVPNQVALLYGPSVDQVFRDVAEEVAEPIADMVVDEFFRQLERLI